MQIHNSLARQIEEFRSLTPGKVGMYTCGPTVYNLATIGNFRTYTMADLLRRVFLANGFDVTYIMNLTDVGHLTGDNTGDASQGEDRLEIASMREQKSAWDIAQHYTNAFIKDYTDLKLMSPQHWVKATDHIEEQIELIKILEERGYAYKIADGIYFDTSKFIEYGKLSTLHQIVEGARVEINQEKRNPKDFALWKFTPLNVVRQMEWDSPWGRGFPGWHVECSAMSMKYLGDTFDVHVGGEDLRSTHHPNEIAQSEAATGKTFVKYWVHVAFLLVNGGRMGKSLNNAYTLNDLRSRKIDLLALKYFYYTGHYRKNINFTWDALEAASNALEKIRLFSVHHRELLDTPHEEDSKNLESYKSLFLDALNTDLNTPQALAVMWSLFQGNLSPKEQLHGLLFMDEVLALGISELVQEGNKIPEQVTKLAMDREHARKNNDWATSDSLRLEIESMGFTVEDTPRGQKILRL